MKEKKPLVSIIIPVYNTKDYIEKGIESVLSQTYKNIELIVINDGSTDGTKELLDNIVKKNNKIKVIHQENLGVSEARNKGLDVLNGEYVCFLDSDDWLSEDAVEFLYNQIRNKQGIISSCDRNFVYQKNGEIIIKRQRKAGDSIKLNTYEALLETGTGRINLQSACYKLFPVYLINGDNKIRFDKEISHGEDGLFVFNVICNAKGIIFSPEPKWNILNRSNSVSNSNYSKEMITALYAIDKMIAFSNNDTKLTNSLKVYYTVRAMGLNIKYIISNEKNESVKKVLKYHLSKYKDSFGKNNINKIKYYFIAYSPEKLIYFVYKLKDIIGS